MVDISTIANPILCGNRDQRGAKRSRCDKELNETYGGTMVHTTDCRSCAVILLPSDDDIRKVVCDTSLNKRTTSMDTATVRSLPCASGHHIHGSDEPLVFAAQLGCRTAFNELFSLYSRRVYRTVVAITKNSEDAEDAMQESLLRAFLAIGRFEGRATFCTWLTRIAINSALMIVRKRRTCREISINATQEGDDNITPMDFQDSALNPEQTYDCRQRNATLKRAIHRLPPILRETVQARLTEDCSIREVAKRLNISENAAKSRLLRARKQLGASVSARYGSKMQNLIA